LCWDVWNRTDRKKNLWVDLSLSETQLGLTMMLLPPVLGSVPSAQSRLSLAGDEQCQGGAWPALPDPDVTGARQRERFSSSVDTTK